MIARYPCQIMCENMSVYQEACNDYFSMYHLWNGIYVPKMMIFMRDHCQIARVKLHKFIIKLQRLNSDYEILFPEYASYF